ncbi:hypothetical protein TNCV_4801521 [Trichonephila clavipes]|nr:hypothetical protein TNCV_4801521 [Trichonephila clavipes]
MQAELEPSSTQFLSRLVVIIPDSRPSVLRSSSSATEDPQFVEDDAHEIYPGSKTLQWLKCGKLEREAAYVSSCN